MSTATIEQSGALPGLNALAAHLLEANPDLADRILLTVLWPVESCLTIALEPVAASLTDLAIWAQRYGGVLLGRTRLRSGAPVRTCTVNFEVDGCRVDVSTNLPLADAGLIIGDCP